MNASKQVFLDDAAMMATLDAMGGTAPVSYEAVAVRLYKALTPDAMAEAAALIPTADCNEFMRDCLNRMHVRYSAELFGRYSAELFGKRVTA